MANYNTILSNYITIIDNIYDESDTKATFVGLPLHFLGDTLFKRIFSNILGFEWLLRLTDRLELPGIEIELPSIIHIYSRHRIKKSLEELLSLQYNSSLPTPRNPMVSGFAVAPTRYKVTPLNFILVAFNYTFRTLGKLVGYTIASPFTIPAYLLIKTFYKIKERTLNDAYQNSLHDISNPALADGWVRDNAIPRNDIVKRITINELAKAHLDARLASKLTSKDIQGYAKERCAFLERTKPWPISEERRKIRSKIEAEQQELSTIIQTGVLNSITTTTTQNNYGSSYSKMINLGNPPTNHSYEPSDKSHGELAHLHTFSVVKLEYQRAQVAGGIGGTDKLTPLLADNSRNEFKV